jgi:hypothetical protein
MEEQAGPRSSNLRLRKTFTERDRDQFLDEAFEFIARLFEKIKQVPFCKFILPA